MTIQPSASGNSPPTGGGACQPEQFDLLALLCGPPSVTQRFRDFHAANPDVYAALVRFTREAITRSRRKRASIAAVYERARWELSLRTTEREPAALNNSYRPFYARLIMAQEADLRGVFETRASVADDSIGSAA